MFRKSLLENCELVLEQDYAVIAKGARNPFRFAVDPVSNNVFFGDVGKDTCEEINEIVDPLAPEHQNQNYGWPCREGMISIHIELLGGAKSGLKYCTRLWKDTSSIRLLRIQV